ncbi:MAG: 3,4-dihydroxy-2-butanone-4-phosphate synthase [Chloroflexi bacterium]|nr:3,4-dihydroxy-2-butanone-4-phosphate synthase [Chloroflexota bacterium]
MLASIETALRALARGEMIVVVDDEDRENEGDLLMLAEYADAKSIAFMAVHGRGLVCLALDPLICDTLDLHPMVHTNRSRTGTAFTVSIEAAIGVTTGISAADRARTIAVAIDPHSQPNDLSRPGHVFPLRARAGGVLERPGHTESAVDFARILHKRPASVICEIMNDDGTMARRPELEDFCARHNLVMTSVAQLVEYRKLHPLHTDNQLAAVAH